MYSDVQLGMKSVCQSSPPQAHVPRVLRDLDDAEMLAGGGDDPDPARPGDPDVARSSHFIPSGIPSSISAEADSLKNMRPFESHPSSLTSTP